MSLTASYVVHFTCARAHLSELADKVETGAEKIVTKHDESYVALVDIDRLDNEHRLERERIHLLLIDDARRGLEDIAADRRHAADAVLDVMHMQRMGALSTARPVKNLG